MRKHSCPYCGSWIYDYSVEKAEQKEKEIWRPWDIIVNKDYWVTDNTSFNDYGDYRYVF